MDTRRAGRWASSGIPVRDVGILPLLATMPFMFFPRVVDGDTQPWILLSGFVALATFRTDQFLRKEDVILVVLSTLCILAYTVRGTLGFDLTRQAYMYLMFLLLWTICRREKGDYFPLAVRTTIVLWFLVGVYQYEMIQLGLQIDFFGRYIAGRSGVPSLTAEPSFYGSLSVLQAMYLLAGNRRSDYPYVCIAVLSVILSGSLLALVLLVFPLIKLPMRFRVGVVVLVSALVMGDYLLSTPGATARLMSIASSGVDFTALLLDPSVNLRLGHIYFTMVVNLVPSLLLLNPVSFMEDYNAFAGTSSLFILTGSNFILPALGEIVYGAGLPGLVLVLVYLRMAGKMSRTLGGKLIKLLFIVACLLNPIQLSNIFLHMYAQRTD